MVLVDTSVWIRALAGRQPYAQGLAELLKNDEVLSHDLVHGELMIGDPDGRRAILAGYLMMDRAATVAHPEVVEFVRARNLSGKGIGWIDVHLLASAMIRRASLWTADGNLANAAGLLGLAYAPAN